MSTNQHTEQHTDFTQEAQRTQKILTGISRTLDTAKVKHQGDRATAVHSIITKLKEQGLSLRVSDRGWVVAEKNGTPVGLQEAVDNLLLTDRTLGDPQSVQEQVAAGALTVAAKADLSTVAQKVEFIRLHGDTAYARLPPTRVAPVEMNPDLMTARDYARLSVKQKIDFQKTITEPQLGAILRRR